jgi:hypothetical protein
MKFPYPGLHLVRTGLACAAVLLAASVHAAEANFTESLSPKERAAVGISKLTPSQAIALDALVSHDATLAQQGGVTGFSTSFLARHTEAERAAAGIGSLNESERAALNSLAARTIAMGPPPDQAFAYSPPQAKAAPPPPVPSETTVSAPLRAQLHGDLSFTVGGGSHGSSFYGTSMDLNFTDPSGKFTIGVGIDEFRGKGPLALYDPYVPYGPYSAYGPFGPGYIGPPYWGP